MNNISFFSYFSNASFVVQLVMLLLIGLSITSWTYIIQHSKFLKNLKSLNDDFEKSFWSYRDLTNLYSTIQSKFGQRVGLFNVFIVGYKEYVNANNRNSTDDQAYMSENIQRAMRIAHAKDMDQIEKHLTFLATVGSISPYIGLFGTVWGIMTSFHALSGVDHATISMVAPGISEALIATALGLFAAIPAVIAYNRFTDFVSKFDYQYTTFQDELAHILLRIKAN